MKEIGKSNSPLLIFIIHFEGKNLFKGDSPGICCIGEIGKLIKILLSLKKFKGYWYRNGKRKVVWRCINRVQGGPERCGSPTIEEQHLHAAIMQAVMRLAKQDTDVLRILKE